MKKINKSYIVNLLKQILPIAIIVFVATFLQFYWSMGHLSERMSSACLQCWFVEDAFNMSLATAVFLAIVYRFLTNIKGGIFKVIIQFLLLVSIWSFWDYTIFVERESSWSTYLFNEELYYVASSSVFPILILSGLTIFLINYKYLTENRE